MKMLLLIMMCEKARYNYFINDGNPKVRNFFH